MQTTSKLCAWLPHWFQLRSPPLFSSPSSPLTCPLLPLSSLPLSPLSAPLVSLFSLSSLPLLQFSSLTLLFFPSFSSNYLPCLCFFLSSPHLSHSLLSLALSSRHLSVPPVTRSPLLSLPPYLASATPHRALDNPIMGDMTFPGADANSAVADFDRNQRRVLPLSSPAIWNCTRTGRCW